MLLFQVPRAAVPILIFTYNFLRIRYNGLSQFLTFKYQIECLNRCFSYLSTARHLEKRQLRRMQATGFYNAFAKSLLAGDAPKLELRKPGI
jgi:hypothetical protein